MTHPRYLPNRELAGERAYASGPWLLAVSADPSWLPDGLIETAGFAPPRGHAQRSSGGTPAKHCSMCMPVRGTHREGRLSGIGEDPEKGSCAHAGERGPEKNCTRDKAAERKWQHTRHVPHPAHVASWQFPHVTLRHILAIVAPPFSFFCSWF